MNRSEFACILNVDVRLGEHARKGNKAKPEVSYRCNKKDYTIGDHIDLPCIGNQRLDVTEEDHQVAYVLDVVQTNSHYQQYLHLTQISRT